MLDITYNVIPVELPAPVRKTYEKLSGDLVGETTSGVRLTPVTAPAAVMKLRQITNGWAYNKNGSVKIHDAKIDALVS